MCSRVPAQVAGSRQRWGFSWVRRPACGVHVPAPGSSCLPPASTAHGRTFSRFYSCYSFCRFYESFTLTNQEPRASGGHPYSGGVSPQNALSWLHVRATLTGLHRSRSVFASISQMWWPSARKAARRLLPMCPSVHPENAARCRQTRPRDSHPLGRGPTLCPALPSWLITCEGRKPHRSDCPRGRRRVWKGDVC